MKKIVVSIFIGIIALSVSAQENKEFKPLKKQTEMVSYFENGQVKIHGFFNAQGKLDGAWVQYDESGNVLVQGAFKNGMKVGKWLFWSESTLKEVDYEANQILKYNQWKKADYLALH